jgi:hypothetical protein
MLKTRLLQAACTVAMLAAAPAFAQTNTPAAGAGMTGMHSPTDQQGGSGNTSMSDSKSSMTPANKDGLGASAKDSSHSTHRSAMAHPSGTMHSSKTDSSQNAAVEDLNNKSYQAAQNGAAMATGGTGNASTGTMKSGGGSGSMNDMSGGSMTGNGSTGNTTKP